MYKQSRPKIILYNFSQRTITWKGDSYSDRTEDWTANVEEKDFAGSALKETAVHVRSRLVVYGDDHAPGGSCTDSGLAVAGVNDAGVVFSVGGACLVGVVSSVGIAVQIVDA